MEHCLHQFSPLSCIWPPHWRARVFVRSISSPFRGRDWSHHPVFLVKVSSGYVDRLQLNIELTVKKWIILYDLAVYWPWLDGQSNVKLVKPRQYVRSQDKTFRLLVTYDMNYGFFLGHRFVVFHHFCFFKNGEVPQNSELNWNIWNKVDITLVFFSLSIQKWCILFKVWRAKWQYQKVNCMQTEFTIKISHVMKSKTSVLGLRDEWQGKHT